MPFEFAERESRAFEDPRSLLRDLLRQVRALLSDLLNSTVAGFDFKPDLGEDREMIERAFDEADGKNRVFDRTMEAVGTLSDADLESAGLRGAALSAKTGLLESFSERLRRGLRKALKYILEMVNAALGSIGKALTGTSALLADAIREIKDMIKSKIDLANGW